MIHSEEDDSDASTQIEEETTTEISSSSSSSSSSSCDSDDDDESYYESYSRLLNNTHTQVLTSAIIDATVLQMNAEGFQSSNYNIFGSNNFNLFTFSPFYVDEQSMLNAAIEESMNSYHNNELLRKNIKRRLSEDAYSIGPYSELKCPNEKCFICFEIFESEDKICKLTICNHGFHETCLQQMVQYNPICALCKSNINTFEDTGQSVSDI